MKKKYIAILKKSCAVITAICFTFTIVADNLYASVNFDTAKSKKQYFEKKDKSDLNSFFSDKYGKVVSYNNNFSSTVVINIQDLHCDYSAQKNIAAIIDEISKKYNINNVYVEGGIDGIDTSFLSNINPQYKKDILERLLKDGKLTGTEYYSAMNDKTQLLKGVEEKDVYLDNIIRLNDIINLKKENFAYLSNINREIDFLKSKYLKSKNKNFDKLVKQSENKEISQEQFIIKLFNYAKQNNISLKNYENLKIYLSLFDSPVKNKKVQKELVEVLAVIKKSLSYDEYNQFVKLTSNLSDIQKIGSFVKNFCIENNIDLNKIYPNLNEFFILKEQSIRCNPIELVKEERKLIDLIRTSLSETETELEVAYLSDFEHFYNGYLSASLTAAQWEYVKLGLDKFKDLYAKYSISNDVAKLEKYSELLTQFYDVNTERNTIFVQKMGLDKVAAVSRTVADTDILSSAKKIVVLVAGGYHTDGINEILNKKGISNITITPNIADSTKDSRLQYEFLAQQQAMSVRQMIALGLISNATKREQILAIVNSLLLNQNLDGVNINILVQQLNQIFSQNITVSLAQDGKQLDFSFKDGSKQFVDIEDDIASIVEEQNKKDLSEGQLVRVTQDKLKNIIDLISKTSFNYGTEIFAPQIYQISKDVCLFMVENKWYLGNGAIWEIANSKYDGNTLDGVEPVVYEYMPEFMQEMLLSKQQSSDNRKKFSLKNLMKRIVSAILVIALTISVTACSLKKNETPIEYRYSPQIYYTLDDGTEFGDEILNELQHFETGEEGVYNSFLYSGMSPENTRFLTKQEINIISNQQNLYDQALVALMFIQQAQIAEENDDVYRKEILLENAASILSAIDSHDVLYKSNLEQLIVTGEILWVGIAATQYKLVTGGSDQFDNLIAKVDKHINMFYRNAGFIYGRADENWVSTEHILDAIAYYNLKLYCDNKYGNSVDFNVQTRLKSLSSYLYKELYDKENLTFYRGRNDNYYVLDTCSWGVQVLSMVEYMNPELFEFGLNGESYLKNIDVYALLDYAENHFSTTVEYNGNVYTNLYVAAEETNAPVMFEWTIQMAISYIIAANKSETEGDLSRAYEYRQKAEDIMRDVQNYSADLGFDYPPYVDQNGHKIYQKNGWIAYQVEFVAGLAQMQQYHYGSFYFPLDDTERKIEKTVPSSILPTTLTKLNNLISEGVFSIKKGLSVILNTETVKSLFNPLSFINSHFQTMGAKILTLVTAIMLLGSFGIFVIFIPIAFAVLSSIMIALGTNIGTHVIIDYRYFKSIGLNEAIDLYGKDKVKLTQNGLSINKEEEQNIPVYVINEKPKNAKDFNFKSVPIRIKTQKGNIVKCWIGNYNGVTVLFAEGAGYDVIVKEFNKTKQFETVYGKRTALKAKVDVIEVDMNNPNSSLRYSDTGNIIVGLNIVKTGGVIDLQKELSLLKNKKIESVTINQNIAIYIDDNINTLSTSQDFINVIDLYVKNENLGVNAKVLFSNEYIDRVLALLEQEQGSKELAQQKFIEIIKQLKDENKEVVVIFDEVSKNMDFNKYKQYGIFSYIAGNEYIDGITATKSQTKFVTNLSQIACFDGSLSIIKVSLFRKEIEQSSSIFTFLTSSLNLKEYMKNRSINFIKQVASNFDYNQIPEIGTDTVAKILKSETKFEDLKVYLNETDSISLYYLGLSNEEEKEAFINVILGRILVANYLREFDNNKDSFGLKNKKMEEILAAALVAKYNRDGSFDILSQVTLNENLTAAQFELEFEKMIMDKVSTGFKNGLSEISDPQSIDDIIKLIPLYAERNAELKTANVKVMEIQDIKGILSAA